MSKFIKRFMDIIMSFTLIIVTAPLLFLISILIMITGGLPIIFKQKRLGIHGEVFVIYKFRTMTKGDHSVVYEKSKVEISEKVTRVGAILRKLSLDELPQLFNILKGEMSFIGPRPALTNHLNRYSSFQKKRLDMKPGITGLAQVNGRQDIPWSTRIEYDLEYVENYSLWLDVKILFKTIKVVLLGSNINNSQQMGVKEDFSNKG